MAERSSPAPSTLDPDWACRRYRPFVLSLANRLARGDPELFQDLAQEGFWGLLTAIRQYDARWGTRFSNYAWVRIRGAMLNYLRDCHPLIRRSRSRAPDGQPQPYCVVADDLESCDERTPDLPRRVVLLEALSRLPERRRRLVWQVVVEKASSVALGRAEGVSGRFVRKEVARGLGDLRRFLEA